MVCNLCFLHKHHLSLLSSAVLHTPKLEFFYVQPHFTLQRRSLHFQLSLNTSGEFDFPMSLQLPVHTIGVHKVALQFSVSSSVYVRVAG